MNTKTRYFMLGSFGILVAGLCTGLVAYYGGFPALATQQRSGPAELAYVPAGAAVVAYADVHDVMVSEMRRRLKDVMPPGEAKGREELFERTGIDLERDIDHIVACMIPRADDDKWDSGFVAFRGRFDAVKLEGLAREHGAAVEEYRGRRLVRMVHPHANAQAEPGRKAMVLAFVEPGLVMFGDDRTVREAIDTFGTGRDVTSNADVMRLVGELAGDANAWAVGRFDVLANHARLPEGVTSQIPAIKWFAAAGRINGGISGSFRAEARDDEAARNLRDVANGFLALARMQAGSRPEVGALLQSVQLSGTGHTVELSFALPAELFDALLPKLRGHVD
jgi:hypothetical protein